MNDPLTPERRAELRGIAADDRHAMTVLAADMLALSSTRRTSATEKGWARLLAEVSAEADSAGCDDV